jgi:DNA-binding XRE family transcriptional regulator
MNQQNEAIVPARDETGLSSQGTEISPGAIAAAETARAMVMAAYGMAQRNPRDFESSRKKILKACERPAFAERVEYSKPVGGGNVHGPSIRFAELALREWGNVRTDVTTIYEDDEIRRIQVTCTDLETNVAFGKQQTIRKTVERRNRKGREVVGSRTNTYGDEVFVVVATEDELATKEAAVVSKVLRNEGLRLIPADVVDEALTTAKDTLGNQDAQDRAGSAAKVTKAFAEIGVTRTQLEAFLGHPIDHEDTDFQELRGIYQAIKQGEAKWREYAPATEAGTPAVDSDTVAAMAEEAASRGGGRQSTVSQPQAQPEAAQGATAAGEQPTPETTDAAGDGTGAPVTATPAPETAPAADATPAEGFCADCGQDLKVLPEAEVVYDSDKGDTVCDDCYGLRHPTAPEASKPAPPTTAGPPYDDGPSVGFGGWVCNLRKRMGLNQAEVASNAGLSSGVLSSIERSKRKPTEAEVQAIAGALGADPAELLVMAGYGNQANAEPAQSDQQSATGNPADDQGKIGF